MRKNTFSRGMICCAAAAVMLAGCGNNGNDGTAAVSGAASDTTAVLSEIAVTSSSSETVSAEQSEQAAASTEATTTAVQLPTPTAEEITLSGNADDIFEAADDCYATGENVILFFQKGVTIRGDMLVTTEQLMRDIEAATGYTFALKRKTFKDEWQDLYFKENAFAGINEDDEKTTVGIVNMTDGAIPMALGNSLVVDNADYNPENLYSVIIHELVHVIQYRNSGLIGRTMDEGYAVYITDKVARNKGIAAWDTIQYFEDSTDPRALISGGESSFNYQFDDNNTNYQYGYRFITFLYDSYGEATFREIAAEAEKQKFDAGFSTDNEAADKAANTAQIIGIIKSKTSDDVFVRFNTWYSQNWSTKKAEYRSYMKSVGAEF